MALVVGCAPKVMPPPQPTPLEQIENMLQEMDKWYKCGNYEVVLELAEQANKLIEQHPKELADKKDPVSSYRDKAQDAKEPSKKLEKMFQEMETLYQRGKYDAMLALSEEADLLTARHSELEKKEYRVWYYKAKAYMEKARQSKSESNFQEAFRAINKSIELAKVLAQAGELNEEQIRPLAQVYLDTLMVGVDILIDQEEYTTAYELIKKLVVISSEWGLYPTDMTPAYKFAEWCYYNAQMKHIEVNDEEAKPDPDTGLMNKLMKEISKFVEAANLSFNWAKKGNPDYSKASILCIRLYFYWFKPDYYFEDYDDPLLISSAPKTVLQISADELIDGRSKLLRKAIVYLDGSDAQVLSKSNVGTLLQTKWGKFYLSRFETDVPVKLIGRFIDVRRISVDGEVQVPELEIISNCSKIPESLLLQHR
jgi:tetratricopeptide (TPR) repeat protein